MSKQAFLALLMVLSLSATGAAQAMLPGCPAPPSMAGSAEALPRVAAALKHGQLDVLAIGSGTMLGSRGRPEGSFASSMAQDLRAAFPGTEIRLTVQGERGMTAAAMLATLRKDLETRRYALVLWQTGTVEAVRKLPTEDLARTLDAGAEAVRQAGADLLLIDPQYSRMLEANADLKPYRETMLQAAQRHGAVLFRRFDVIRSWAKAGQLDLESAAKPERMKIADQLNTCLGQALAQTVVAAAGMTGR